MGKGNVKLNVTVSPLMDNLIEAYAKQLGSSKRQLVETAFVAGVKAIGVAIESPEWKAHAEDVEKNGLGWESSKQ